MFILYIAKIVLFFDKIKRIQSEFASHGGEDTATWTDTTLPPEKHLSNFELATEDEILKLIKESPAKSCSLDIVPTFNIKEFASELVPITTSIINCSLMASSIPPALKTAIVTPILKKPSDELDELSNYRPVSNLPYLSKLLEKVVSSRLHNHKVTNNLYEHVQSAYRSGHSTETALVKVQNDILRANDVEQQCVFLVLLDLSAAFDTITHQTLLSQMKTKFGIVDEAHRWLTSYLEGRTQSVMVSGAKSSAAPLTCGVPQGSVLGPGLFTNYSSPVVSMIKSFDISVHCYADDTQLYAHFIPGENESEVLARMERCIDKLRKWMHQNKLKLNDKKTEFIIFGTETSLKKVQTAHIRVGTHIIERVDSVRNIGAIFDEQMRMEKQVGQLCKSAWLYLYKINKIRQYLTTDQVETIVYAFVTTKLDLNNSLLAGLPGYIIHRLQLVQNAAAKTVADLKKFDHVTQVLQNLNWLPVAK